MRSASPLTSAILVLLLSGLLVKAFIPAGFMPAAGNAETLVRMVICSGMGEKTIFVHGDGTPLEKKHNGPDKPLRKLCDYQFLSGQKSLVPGEALTLIHPAPSLFMPVIAYTDDIPKPVFSFFTARGPPSLSGLK